MPPARRVSLGVLWESSMGLGFIGRLSLPRPRCYLSTIELSGPERCGMLVLVNLVYRQDLDLRFPSVKFDFAGDTDDFPLERGNLLVSRNF